MACSITNSPTTLNFVLPWLPTTRREVSPFLQHARRTSDCGTCTTDCSSPGQVTYHWNHRSATRCRLCYIVCSCCRCRTTGGRRDENSGHCSGPASDIWEARHDGGSILPLSCTSSDTYATYCQRSWHRHWRAAWYWRGWTTVIQCFTAHIPAVSRHYSACITSPPGLFCKHRGSATQTRCCASSIGCRFVTESNTSCTRSTAPVYLHTSSHQPSRNNMNITFIWHFTVHRTIHQEWAREACLPMRSSICLKLTTFIHHQ